jgi:hypothetical protein
MQPATARPARRAHTAGLAPLCIEPVIGKPDPWHPRSADHGDRYPHVLARIAGPSADTAAQAESHSWRLLTALASPLGDHPRLYAERYLNTHYDPVVAAWPLLCPWQPDVTGGAFKLNRIANGLQHASPAPLAGYRIIETVSPPPVP